MSVICLNYYCSTSTNVGDLSSSPLLIEGVDPTETLLSNNQNDLFKKIRNIFKK